MVLSHPGLPPSLTLVSRKNLQEVCLSLDLAGMRSLGPQPPQVPEYITLKWAVRCHWGAHLIPLSTCSWVEAVVIGQCSYEPKPSDRLHLKHKPHRLIKTFRTTR